MEITATEFKSKCLSLMDQVQEKLEEVVITKHGKPIAKLVPVQTEVESKSPIGFMRGKVTIKDDIVKPLGVDWNF
jgi:prevent-host-death family protein